MFTVKTHIITKPMLPATNTTNATDQANHDASTSTAVNTWYHVVFVYDGINSKIYRNGVLLNSLNIGYFTNIINNSDLFKLATSKYDETQLFNGAIDDLKIYNYAISDAEVSNLFSNNTLATENFNSQKLKATIYPNPTSNDFSIEMENEVKSIEVFSLQGQKVLTTTNKNVNVSNLS